MLNLSFNMLMISILLNEYYECFIWMITYGIQLEGPTTAPIKIKNKKLACINLAVTTFTIVPLCTSEPFPKQLLPLNPESRFLTLCMCALGILPQREQIPASVSNRPKLPGFPLQLKYWSSVEEFMLSQPGGLISGQEHEQDVLHCEFNPRVKGFFLPHQLNLCPLHVIFAWSGWLWVHPLLQNYEWSFWDSRVDSMDVTDGLIIRTELVQTKLKREVVLVAVGRCSETQPWRIDWVKRFFCV